MRKDSAADLDGLSPDALKAMVRELRRQRDALQRENAVLRRWVGEHVDEVTIGGDANGDEIPGQVDALRAGWIEMAASLRESEERFRKLFEEMPVGMAFTDIETSRYTMANPAFCRMLGYTAEELTRLTIEDVSHPEDMVKNAELFRYAVSGDSPSYTMEKRYLSKDGRIVWGSLTGVVISDASGAPRFRAGMIQDITERKEMEAELWKRGETFRVLAESAPVCIFIAQGDRFVYVNPRFLELTGYTGEEVQRMSVLDLIHPDMRSFVRERLHARLRGETVPSRYEIKNQTRTGESLWLDHASAVIDYEGEPAILGISVDITERKRAEAALRESERRYRRLADHSTDIITEFDPSIRPVYVSPSVRKLTGYTEDEFLSLSLEQNLTPESLRRAIQSHRSRKPGDHGAKINELEHVRKDGSTFWAENITQPIVDESGEVTGYLATTRDITERKQAEERLRENESQFRAMFEAHKAVMLLVAPDTGAIVRANQAACDFYGYDRETLSRLRIYDINRLSRAEIETKMVEVRAQRRTYFHFPHQLASGEVRQVELYSSPVQIEDKTLLLSIIHDITERKEAEAALKESEQRFRAVFEQAAAGIGIAYPDGTLMAVNRKLREILGYTEEELLARTVEDVTFPEDVPRETAIVAKILAGHKDQYNIEKRFVRKDGELVWAYLSSNVVRNEAGEARFAIGVMADITDRVEAMAALKEARRAAEAASRAKSDFISNMSHELRTPLNVILGYGQLLSRDPGLTETHRDQIVAIRRSGEHLLTLINDILDISRIEADKLRIDPQPTDLKVLVSNMVEMLSVKAAKKRIKLSAWVDPTVPEFVMADDKRLRQVLLNLLSNALKFTQEGSVRLSVLSGGDRISFQVTDTGVGIPDDQQEVIFESFVQLGNILNKEEGTGLGLAISQKLARMMGGEITVESTVGAGSVFSFEVALPRVDTGPESGWRSDAPVKRVDRSKTRRRALIVDDKAMDRRVMGDMLWSLGFEAEAVAEGGNALDRLLAFWPEVVLLDWVLPEGISAETVIREIRAMIPKGGPAIIVITGKADHGVEAAIRKAGADGCLIKPIRMDDLQKALEAHLPLTWTAEGSDKRPDDARPAELEMLPPPPLEDVKAIHDMSRMGDFRGIVGYLERMRESNPDAADFCDAMERPLKRFELKRIKELMEIWMGGIDEK